MEKFRKDYIPCSFCKFELAQRKEDKILDMKTCIFGQKKAANFKDFPVKNNCNPTVQGENLQNDIFNLIENLCLRTYGRQDSICKSHC